MQDEEQAVETPAEGEAGGEKSAKPEKVRRSYGDRAAANLRAAKRNQREVGDPAERSRLMLQEANVLALLELADALRSNGKK